MSMKKFAYTPTLYVHEMKSHLDQFCLCCIPISENLTFYYLKDEEGNSHSRGLNKAELQTTLRERYYQLVKTEECPNVANGKHKVNNAYEIWVDRWNSAACCAYLCFPCMVVVIPRKHTLESCTLSTYRLGAPAAPDQLTFLGNVFLKADGSIEIRG